MVKFASIVLCAGVGSRLKSTKAKILHELCGRPLGYWPIKTALDANSCETIVVVGHQALEHEEILGSYFQDSIKFAHQKQPDGTAGAVAAALKILDPSCTSVAVICGDTALLRKESLQKLITIQSKSHVPIALLTAQAPDPTGYGRIVRNSSEQIAKIVEDKEAGALEREIREVNTGVYVFDTKFLRENISKISNNNAQHEYYLTDLIELYLDKGPKDGPVESFEINFEEMLGINDRCQLAHVQSILNRRLLNYWMLEGVSIIDPSNTYIEEGVRLARDCVIYPGAHLRGQTHIGEGAIIENGAVIINSIIEKQAHILPYSWCERAYVGERTQVGPFARLRAGTHLENDVKIGNFVEIKQSYLKSGTKAGHLAYIGDAQLGQNCNVGAGAITCNYDGEHKHKTLMSDGVFVGSNATLIAPLYIGRESYIAGGSVISEDVPDNSLAIGRAHQVNKQKKPRRNGLAEERLP